eukprot:COSAG01_NODE_9103_length_2554_cov_1.459063_1_plen_52_part_10
MLRRLRAVFGEKHPQFVELIHHSSKRGSGCASGQRQSPLPAMLLSSSVQTAT